MSRAKRYLLVIDAQNDFHDQPNATLGVPGAMEDAKRIAHLIASMKDGWDDIRATVDTHQRMAIFFGRMWKDKKGGEPDKFRVITKDEVLAGEWMARQPVMQPIFENYVTQLAAGKRYELRIWPDHCLFGTWGYCIQNDVANAFGVWEEKYAARVGYEQKGHNMLTEHYSAVKADVQSDDPTTQMNTRLVDALQEAQELVIVGQARSHCVANTGIDVADYFGPDAVKQLIFLKDCMSDVEGCEALGEAFLKDMAYRGAHVMTAKEYLN